MSSETLTSQESYNPNRLLDHLIERLHLKNDAALSRALEVAPPVISKIRHRRLPVGASMLIRMHEVSSLSVRELRDLMGDRRTKYRLSDAQGKPKPSMEAGMQEEQPQGQQSSPQQQPQGGHSTHHPHQS
jgi:hypothetical protein